MSASAISSSVTSAYSHAGNTLNVKTAMDHVSLQADRLMLVLVAIASLLAFPIGWHYTNMDIASWAAPLLIALAGVLYACCAGRVVTRYALPLILCAAVALQIQVSLGTVEFHFGVFVTLALVMVYRQWRVVVACAVFFAVHHILFDRLQAWGYGIYCTSAADFQKIVLHAIFVVLQTAVEIFILLRISSSFKQGIELQALVNAIHDGDRFNLHIANEHVQTPLARDLKQLILKLDSIVRTVTDSVEQLQATGQSIQSGSSDLSVRTETACSALEETANAAARVLSIVEQARSLAQQADRLTNDAADAAQQSHGLVEQLAQSMGTINQQSEQIAEIATVVDGLAFQTNLLALNAAVEAARAGEHGRGFAVVAEEVRHLALRSADSAKQIRQLIQTSEQTVSLGSTQSKNALDAISALSRMAHDITSRMQDIASATHSQTEAMSDITEAIHQLESTMSQNASLAEQSSASASSLQRQTVHLADSVQAFKN